MLRLLIQSESDEGDGQAGKDFNKVLGASTELDQRSTNQSTNTVVTWSFSEKGFVLEVCFQKTIWQTMDPGL